MAADKKTRKSARTGSAASLRASSEARWLAAERDTHHMRAMLDAWEESGGMGERAWQYAQMARVYFKKLRNGRRLLFKMQSCLMTWQISALLLSVLSGK